MLLKRNVKEGGRMKTKTCIFVLYFVLISLFPRYIFWEGNRLNFTRRLKRPVQEWESVMGVAQTLLYYREGVDYLKLVSEDTEVLLFGEEHTVQQTKRELSQNMALFKRLGFTHLCLEMFSTDVQWMLDEYFETGGNKDQIIQYLKKTGLGVKKLLKGTRS